MKLPDYAPLTDFFEDVAPAQEAAAHLDKMLYSLVYYQHKEGTTDFFEAYSIIHELKQVLQSIN